ncbi:hypothetical protein [Microbacterium sp. EST19A]|uniref:hypothetical protein n=1 Tax=Microbacterium sp. EST19A TaxID=2862681 RepID=UPI001CBB7978|nr:hypothetical protein [Microbacterium sp. EST19A]
MTDTTPAPRSAAASAAQTSPTDKPAGRSLGLAIASLFFALSVPIPVWGLFMLFLAVPLGIAALVGGHSRLKTSRTSGAGRRKVTTALVLAYTSLAICALTTLFWVITMAIPR